MAEKGHPVTPDMAACQDARVCKKPYLCNAERACYFVEAVDRHDQRQQQAAPARSADRKAA